MKKNLIICLFIFPILLLAQNRSICKKKIDYYLNWYAQTVGLFIYTQAPLVKGGIENICNKVDYTAINKYVGNGTDIVKIAVIIDEKGSCICDSVIYSTNINLNTEAIRVVKNIEYIPAMQDSNVVESFMIVPVYFNLHGFEAIKKEFKQRRQNKNK